MKLLNYRTGFASNSSSTHSVYISENPVKLKDRIYSDYFGWEQFVISSKTNLNKYIVGQLLSNLNWRLPEYLKRAFINYFFPNFKMKSIEDFGVDHQSRWYLPRYKKDTTGFPSEELIRDVINYIETHNVVIVGGNDNEGDPIPIDGVPYNSGISNKLESIEYLPSYNELDSYVFKDKVNNVWKFFNKTDGTKIRFSFDNNVEYEKSDRPELVDLIISNQCEIGCKHCYRNCRKHGDYASSDKVYEYLKTLDDLDVFEIAIGGGNILEYPELSQLCSSIRLLEDLVINTTLYLPYTRYTYYNKDNLALIMKSFNSVSFTVNNAQDIALYIREINSKDWGRNNNNHRYPIQMVPELIPVDELRMMIEMIKVFGLSVTLLGVKKTGRCSNDFDQVINNSRERKSEWLDKLIEYSKNYYIRIGIDTQFIKNFPEIKEVIPSWSYTEEEGKFSCCIDVVDETISRSSFDNEKIPLNERMPLSKQILKKFANF